MTVYEYEVYHDNDLYTFDNEADAMEVARTLTKESLCSNHAIIVRKREFGGPYSIYLLKYLYKDVFRFEVLM